jgi:hypothetical protein
MKSAIAHKIDRNGAWQPYIPTLGVATGCRTGPRNESERFNIAYIAERYQDQEPAKRSNCETLPVAAKCSFSNSSMIPISDISDQLREQSRFARPSRKNEGALQAGLVPVENSDMCDPNRPHRGAITRQTGFVVGDRPTVFECAMYDGCRVPRRTNDQTLKPPDNLSIHLEPHEEYSLKERTIRRPDDVCLRSTSLGQGLIPLPCTKDETGAVGDINSVNEPLTKATVYQRVYGLYGIPPCN